MKRVFSKLFSKAREIVKRASRSGEWRLVEKAKLKTQSVCEVCGTSKSLQVHHIKPYARYPELELEPDNLVVLCMDENDCHITIGHGNAWKYWNPEVEKHIKSVQNGKEICLVQEEAKYARKRIK